MNKIFILLFILIIFALNKVIILSANDDTYINSNNIIYNEKENVIELAENSKINFKNTNILIDKGVIDYNKNEFEVFGNFYLYEELNIISGIDLKGNTSLDVFTANNVSYLYNDDLKIDSESLSRENNLVYFYNNFLTPCEIEGYFNCPTWSLRIDKTEYNVEKDKFNHYDTFLQIADKKVFYLPYFSHYGTKAPRRMGFLTPTIEFTIGGGQSLRTPYYIPLNENSDVTITPKFVFDENFQFLENYHLNSIYQNKRAGGNFNMEINNIIRENSEEINTSLTINTEQIIDKNKKFSASGHFTNSISASRSINEEPVTFENLFVKLENYNLLTGDDYLNTEISTVRSFDSTDINQVPISPIINYHNKLVFNNYSILNNFDFTILDRDISSETIAHEGLKLNLSNELIKNFNTKNFYSLNKVKVNNSLSKYEFNANSTIKDESLKSNFIYSSDLYFRNFKKTMPRFKLILPYEFYNDNEAINEDSRSITFNYNNQFSENRLFGMDIIDNSPRLIYGLENNYDLFNQKFSFYINQAYDFKKNNNYHTKVNQYSNFSDYNLLAKTKLNERYSSEINIRLDQKNYSKKEMNYSFKLSEPIIFDIQYNETEKDAFESLSGDSKTIILNLGKEINENLSLNYVTSLDLNDNYNPYTSSINLNIYDECSRLEIVYRNSRFNDNFHTTPSETVSFRFYMDYLGFFGYAQSTDLFFKEPGTVDYGL